MSNSKYITVSVEILIDTESDLYNRLTRLSEVQKSTFEETVEQVVTPGIWRHMEDYCFYYEKRPLIREQR